MDPAPGVPASDADGVLVISGWASGAGGGLLARVTMSVGTDADPVVRVATSPVELHAAVDDWLTALRQ